MIGGRVANLCIAVNPCSLNPARHEAGELTEIMIRREVVRECSDKDGSCLSMLGVTFAE